MSSPLKRVAEFDSDISDDEIGSKQPGSSRKRNHVDSSVTQSPGLSSKSLPAGVIEEVTLTDFMCHKKVTTTFGPKINFLIGHNGSGKSAILTAITLALGGKTSATQRGSNLRTFIREGTNSAEVKLRLRNRGGDPYLHSTYGDSITIIRRIVKDGANSFKIQNHWGKTVSSKAADVTQIIDHFTIQPDNPISVLTQDAARSFLNSTDPKEKYNFYLKGTQLTQLQEDYLLLQRNVESISETIKSKSAQLPDLKKDFDIANNRYEEARATLNQKERLAQLKKDYLWSKVAEKRKALEHQAQIITAEESKIPELEVLLEQNNETVNVAEQYLRKLENEINDDSKEKSLEEERTKIYEQLKDMKSTVKEIHARRRDISASINENKHRFQEIEYKIQEEERKLAASKGGIHQSLSEDIRRLREENVSLSETLVELETAEQSVNSDYEQSRKPLKAIQIKLDDARKAVDNANDEKARLMRQRKNDLLAYGDKVPEILDAIKRERDWDSPPLGPIGKYVKLKDPKWAKVLESVFNQILNSFIVTTPRDRERLLRIIKRYPNTKIQVITQRHDPNFDFSHAEPDPHFLTIVRVLEFTNTFVRDVIVTAIDAESTILVEDRREGDEVMRNRQPNISKCFLISGFRLGGLKGGSSMVALDAYRGSPRLVDNVEQHIRQAETAAQEAKVYADQVHREKQELDAKVGDLYKKKLSINQQIRNTQNAVAHKEEQIMSKQEQLREDEPASIAAFEESKAELQRNGEKLDKELLAMEQKLINAQSLQVPLTKNKEHLDKMLSDINSDRSNRAANIEVASKKHRVAIAGVQKVEKDLEELNGSVVSLKDVFASLEREMLNLNDSAAAAWEGGADELDRIAQKTPDRYMMEISSLEKVISDSSRRVVKSLEQLEGERENAKNRWQASKAAVDNCAEINRLLKESHIVRINKWDLFRKHIANRSRMQFLNYLSQRGFSGKLNFHHKEGKLDIHVITEASQKNLSKEAKSLSGGEKSFSTICLLLTLWEAMGCPLRCLDEFDVFMDAVNRKISMDMMISVARSTQNTQFIFITPQAMGNVNFGPDVRICKLSDPGRNQGLLAFGR